jgi:competence ComEA-like helix-hairpin-helix protein
MFCKYFWVGLALAAGMSCAVAAVDVNVSDEVALEGVTGIGSAKARAIVKEREANGPYRDADDLAGRIDGLGPKSVEKLLANGLMIGGSGGAGTGGAGGVAAGHAPAVAAPPGASPGKSSAQATQTAKK